MAKWDEEPTYEEIQKAIENGLPVKTGFTFWNEEICPYCGHNAFVNCWGKGNARCDRCEQVFVFDLKQMKGFPLPHTPGHTEGSI